MFQKYIALINLFVIPSLEDNLPNTVIESLTCGTPCVAFNIGGIPDMIDHKKNGYLAEAFNIESFVKGIAWVLGDQDRYNRLSISCKKISNNLFDNIKVIKKCQIMVY